MSAIDCDAEHSGDNINSVAIKIEENLTKLFI
jgi:hypothetical protein